MSKKKFVIIDGNNLLFRAYYALPLMANFDGEFSNGVFGFTNMLVRIIKEYTPDYIAVCFDRGKNFRSEFFADYKAQRSPAPQELLMQFGILDKMLDAMHIKHLGGDGLEADDLIGCLSNMYDTENIIVTADKDCLQLIKDNTVVLQPHKGLSESIIVDKAKLHEIYGIEPRQIVDLKSLMGDASDNIPGVKGVGEKTALNLLHTYGTLDNVYANIANIKGKLQEKLVNDKDNAYLSHKLATIVDDKILPYDLEEFTYDFPFNNDVLKLFKQYQFNSLIKKAELFDVTEDNNFNPETLTVDVVKIDTIQKLEKWLKEVANTKLISLHLTDNELSVFDGTKAYIIPFAVDLIDGGLDYEQTLVALQPLFEGRCGKIVFDSKALKHNLHKIDMKLNNVKFDIMLARYVLNSVGKATVTFDDVVLENNLGNNVNAVNLFEIYKIFEDKLKNLDQTKLYYDMELPLVDVLFDMEIQGFKLDIDELERQQQIYQDRLLSLTEQIYAHAGRQFNINSPKQLGDILFDEMGLNTRNNKKKSTNAQVLEEIYDKHPIVPLIIEYRLISKLYTTYIVAYLQMINKSTGKIYTYFNQLVTTTGRLSSSEPNLQNIPVRTEEGKNIRKIFVPSYKDGYIVTADYSQIELRLLADFSGDEKLINAFNSGTDIHTLTASEVFGVPLNEVTSSMRRSAKAINFGIVYGISDYGLSQNISISVAEANSYIKSYFTRYPSIEKYMKDNVEFCKQNGFVTTMFGRRRYIPEINSAQYMTRQFGERAAKNMPLQGSASDIIKLAMVKVHNELTKANLRSKLILQVHDELIVDTAPDELNQVKSILKTCMENVVDLQVKLSVNVECGHNWYDAKD